MCNMILAICFLTLKDQEHWQPEKWKMMFQKKLKKGDCKKLLICNKKLVKKEPKDL